MALKKVPNPTFKQIVEIPVPGEAPEKIECLFKYKSKTAYKDFIASCVDRDDVENAMEIIDDWKIADVFGPVSKESIADLFEAYPGAPIAFIQAYVKGLHQGKLGN